MSTRRTDESACLLGLSKRTGRRNGTPRPNVSAHRSQNTHLRSSRWPPAPHARVHAYRAICGSSWPLSYHHHPVHSRTALALGGASFKCLARSCSWVGVARRPPAIRQQPAGSEANGVGKSSGRTRSPSRTLMNCLLSDTDARCFGHVLAQNARTRARRGPRGALGTVGIRR